MPYDLSNFDLAAMLQCSNELRREMAGSLSTEDAAQRIVRHLHANCREPATGKESCALVRFYMTVPYAALEPSVQPQADKALGDLNASPTTQFLTLLATAGENSAWNNRRRSLGHQAIPLVSVEMVSRAPMISQLIREMGLEIINVVSPPPVVLEQEERRNYNVFHVEEALGSPYIPAQKEFVVPYGIRSIVGFGGVVRNDLFAVILFSRVKIARASAERFRSVALELRRGLFDIEPGNIWGRARDSTPVSTRAQRITPN